MSIGSVGGIAASAAGSPLAQTKGSDVDRAQQDASSQQRQIQNEKKAESAAGIGEADGEDHQTAERDADGRRLWEKSGQSEPNGEEESPGQHRGKDATGQSGNLLDLSG
ncbi:MAG: hypothetical protein GXY83_08220 [Rhodopirellula sp.]|nr:hypothetical protein [Rhodopirellula sp.]